MATRHYRLRIRNQANTSDLLVLSSVTTDAHPQITGEPRGEGQSIDPISGERTVGRYLWRAWDKFESGVSYTITKILADANARNQVLSNRCYGEYSVNAGASWLPLHTGFLNKHQLITAGEFEITIGDTDRREQQAEVFRYVDRTNFPRVSCILGGPIPGGFLEGQALDYGPVRFKKIPNPTGLINPNNRMTLQLVSGYLRPYYNRLWTTFEEDEKNTINRLAAPYFVWDADSYKTNGTQTSQPFGAFPDLVVEMTAVVGGAVTLTYPIATEAKKFTIGSNVGTSGETTALVNGISSQPRMIVRWDTAVLGALPADNTQFDILAYPKAVSESAPVHFVGHPVDLVTLLWAQQGVVYNVTAAGQAKTDLGNLWCYFTIEGPEKLTEFLKKYIYGPFGLAARINSAGEQVLFATRVAAPAVVSTVTVDDLVTEDGGPPRDVIFDVDERTVINGVDYTFRTFRRFVAKTSTARGDNIDDQTIDLLFTNKLTIQGRRAATSSFGTRVLEYDVLGLITMNTGVVQPIDLKSQFVELAGDVVIDRRGWGAIQGTIRIRGVIVGEPGDYIDLAVPHQVNAKVAQTPKAQRGGTRKVQIVKRTEMVGAALLEVEDAGNVAQAPPTGTGDSAPPGVTVPTFTLAPSSVSPLTIATATVTNPNDVEGEVHFEYLIQSATPAGTDPGADMGYLPAPQIDATIDSPEVPIGQKLWERAQTRVVTTGQVSAWSSWQSILLGPDTNGGGKQVPTPSLSAVINATTGQLDAEASVTAAVTSVKFAVGAAGGAPPSAATVRAATADTSAPFQATNLATMAIGEVRTIGAFAYDALGNESLMGVLTVTRAGTSVADASFVTVDDESADLPNSRQITAGTGITITDNGPANTIEIAAAAGGISSGKPGDGSDVFFAMGAATLQHTAHPSGDESVECAVLRINAQNIRRMHLESTVIVAGAAAAELFVEYSIDSAGSWVDSLVKVSMAAASAVMPQVGLGVNIATAMKVQGLLLRLRRRGGNSSASPECYDARIRYTSTAAPSPTDMLADWDPTEGSGATVADKTPNAHDLTLAGGAQAPTWVADPTRGLQMGPDGAFLCKVATNSDLPFAGAADGKSYTIFLYFKAAGTVPDQWLFRFTDGTLSKRFKIVSGKPYVDTNWNGGNITSVTGATTIAASTGYTICMTHGPTTSEKVRLYLNGVQDGETALGGTHVAWATQPVMTWGAEFYGFTSDPACTGILGRGVLYSRELSAAEVLALHEDFQNIYPGLP